MNKIYHSEKESVGSIIVLLFNYSITVNVYSNYSYFELITVNVRNGPQDRYTNTHTHKLYKYTNMIHTNTMTITPTIFLSLIIKQLQQR